MVHDLDGALIAAAHDMTWMVGVKGQECAFTSGGGLPARRGDVPAAKFAVGDDQRSVVLLPTVYPIRKNIVNIDPIELGGGHIGLTAPGLATIHGDDRTTIIRQDHIPRIAGIDPQIMMITMLGIHRLPGLSSIR